MGNTDRRGASIVWEWLKARWRWVVVGAALLLSFLFGFFRRPKAGPFIQPEEDETKRKLAELQQTAEAKAKGLADKAARERETQIIVIREETEDLADDDAAINAYVIEAGKEVRKP
jgi:hypothetical protein